MGPRERASRPAKPRRGSHATVSRVLSFASALSFHQLIDQLPRDISVASLDRAKQIRTAVTIFVVHHLPPDLFGGWVEEEGIKVASPEKALFDPCYVSSAHGARQRRIPELELQKDFDRKEIARWLERIASP